MSTMNAVSGTPAPPPEAHSPAPERVLMAGCGRLGQAVGLRLKEQGARVFGLRRNPADLPAGIVPLKADLMCAHELTDRLPQDISLIYYIVTPQHFDDQSYRLAFVTGLANLRTALNQQGQTPRRLVFVSSTGVYGHQADEWIDEASPTEPQRFSGERLLEAERLALESPWPSAIARLGGIYGPGRDMFIAKVRAGEPCRPAGFTNRIHAADAAAMLAHLGRSTTPAGIYLGVDDEPCTQCQVMDYIAEQLGLPRPPRDAANAANTRGVGSKRGDNSKLKQSGYSFLYPTFRDGYAALIQGEP